jgi:hypothetical protein
MVKAGKRTWRVKPQKKSNMFKDKGRHVSFEKRKEEQLVFYFYFG